MPNYTKICHQDAFYKRATKPVNTRKMRILKG